MNKIYSLENITDLDSLENADRITDARLLQELETIFNMKVSDISDIHPFLLRWLINKLESYNRLTEQFSGSILKNTTNDNIYNFALAKQNTFLKNIKMIKRSKTEEATQISNMKKTANLMFKTQQDVENTQVAHNTKSVEKIYREGRKNMLKYVSEGDSKVRHHHEIADGITLPSTDSFWNRAFNLLGDWNCRCEIIAVEDDAKIKTAPKNLKIPTSTQVPTAINLDNKDGKVIIFKEELDVFKNKPSVIRKGYKANGF